MSGWVSGEKASLHYRGKEPLETSSRRTLHWETAVVDFLSTFQNRLVLDHFDNDEWSSRQWVEMFVKRCACEVLEACQKEWQGSKRLATDLGVCGQIGER